MGQGNGGEFLLASPYNTQHLLGSSFSMMKGIRPAPSCIAKNQSALVNWTLGEHAWSVDVENGNDNSHGLLTLGNGPSWISMLRLGSILFSRYLCLLSDEAF